MAKWLISTTLCAALVMAGCAHSETNEPQDAPETRLDGTKASGSDAAGSVASPVGVDSSNQVTGVGATPRCEASACERDAKAWVSAIASPSSSPPSFVGGHCGSVSIRGVAVGPACLCDGAGRGSRSIGPAGAGCFAAGRAGDCLWDDSEYEPCSADDDMCPELCKELETRYKADAEATFDAELRSSSCGTNGLCHRVVRVADSCFADASIEKARSYDCALSDEEILDQNEQALELDRQVSSCTGPVPDSSTCITIKAPALDECAPRPADEWQGLRVCPPRPPCTKSENCSLALACVDGLCNACTSDDQCAPGEGCALDHCMPSAQISCHGRADCQEGELCILNGTSNGLRGNADMRAYCQGSSGGASQAPRH